MSRFDGIQVGDRVRVVVEAEVEKVYPSGNIKTTERNRFRLDQGDIVSVEKLAPPVVQFQPGDRLARKGWNGSLGYEVTLTDTGYVHHGANHHHYAHADNTEAEFFSSNNFEKVN